METTNPPTCTVQSCGDTHKQFFYDGECLGNARMRFVDRVQAALNAQLAEEAAAKFAEAMS